MSLLQIVKDQVQSNADELAKRMAVSGKTDIEVMTADPIFAGKCLAMLELMLAYNAELEERQTTVK